MKSVHWMVSIFRLLAQHGRQISRFERRSQRRGRSRRESVFGQVERLDHRALLAAVSISSSTSSIPADGGSATISATLSAPQDHDVFVNLGFGGSAANNIDYRATSNSAPITIDGDFSDWRNNPNVVFGTDPANNTHDTDTTGENNTPRYVNHPDVDLREFAVTHDDQNLYFYFRSTGIIGRTQQADPSQGLRAGRYYVIVTMDVDHNDTTGYPLHEGGYYPTTSGYDMNSEIEFYNGTFNTGNYLNHGATDQASLNQAFKDQSSGEYDPALANQETQGPYDPGFVRVVPGTYDYYSEWVYKENDPANNGRDSVTFVRDKGPVVDGIIRESTSADGHELEMVVPYKGFLVDQSGQQIVSPGKILDLSFSLEASGELAPGNEWASNTADPLNNYRLTPTSDTPVNVIRIPAGQTSASITLTGIQNSANNSNHVATILIDSVVGATVGAVPQTQVTLTSNAPVLTLNPVSQSIHAGQTVQFTATATGDPAPSIQWQVSTNGGATFSSIANATSTPYSLTVSSAQNGNQYRAVFTNSNGTTTSSAATLTVLPIEVTTLTDEDNGTVSANVGSGTSLREAIRFANSQPGQQTIDFAPGLTGTMTLSSGQLPALTGNVTIIGAGAPNLTINAHGASRIFEVSPSGIVNLSGLTLINGNGTPNGSTNGLVNGGAILNSGTLTIQQSAISGNVINGNPTTGSGRGGAIYNIGTLTVLSSTFNGNTSTLGNGGGIANAGTLFVTNSTFSGNSSKSGGAVENMANATISSSTFYGNSLVSGAQVGTGISNNGGSLLLTNTIVDSYNNLVPSGSLNPASSHNLFVSGGIGVPTNGTNGNIVVSSLGQLKLAPLANNGGPTKTIAELSGSPAIGAGTTTNVGLDQRGVTRHVVPDIGAFEVVVPGAPFVVTNPQSQSIAVGQTVTFSAAATGNPTASVQWQVSTDQGISFTNIVGATSTTYGFVTTLSQNNNRYRAVFTNANGTEFTSAATLTVTNPVAPPVVTLNPTDQSINAGLVVTFTAAASGSPTPSVQWQRSVDGGLTFSNIAGATSASYSFTVAVGQDGYQFRAVFTNGSGTATTTAANLFVQAQATPPKITLNPASQSIPDGNSVTFSAAATGVPTPTIQWQVSTNGGSTYTNISGATSTTYSFNVSAAQSGYVYRAIFTNGLGSTPTTAATLTVTAPATPPTVTQNPTSVTTVVGNTATFTVAATGIPFPTVQWQVSTDLGTSYRNIPGATSRQYSVAATYDVSSYRYRAIFTNVNGIAVTSSATLVVTPPSAAPVVTVNPTLQSVLDGQRVTFGATASGSPSPSVQWQVSTNGGTTYSNIFGATSTVYSFFASLSQSGYRYRAIFTNASGTATTTGALLIVGPATAVPVVTLDPTDLTVNSGQTATFTATASGGPVPTVQWQSSSNGSAFTDIPGATSTTLSFTATSAQTGFTYHAVFTNSQGTVTTKDAKLTVNTGPVVTTNPTSQTATAGQSVTFTAAADGSPAPTVQWQLSTNGGTTYTDISGATSATLSVTATAGQDGTLYRAVFTNIAGATPTTAAKLSVISAPFVTLNPLSQTIPVGQTVTFTAAASGNPAATVQWRVSTDGGATYTNIAGATSTSLSFVTTATQKGNLYLAVFTNSSGFVQTSAAVLGVLSAPVITQNPVSQSVIVGNSVTFTAAAAGNPTPTVQWQVSTNNGGSYSNITGATSATYTLAVAAGMNGYRYRAVFTNTSGSANTTAATLTALKLPAITQDPANVTVVSSQTATFTSAATGTGTLTVQWQVSTNGGATFSNIPGATSTTYSFVTDLSQNGNQYRAVFSDATGAAVTKPALLTVTSSAPLVNTSPFSQSIAAGRSVTFTANATNPLVTTNARTNAVATAAPTIQWQVSTDGGRTFTNVAGAKSNTLTFVTSTTQNGYQYRAVFTSNNQTTTTVAATLSVLAPPVVKTNPTSQSVAKGTNVTFTAAATANPVAAIQWQVSTNGGLTFTNITGATSSTLSILAAAANNGYFYRAVFTNSQGTATTSSAKLTVR